MLADFHILSIIFLFYSAGQKAFESTYFIHNDPFQTYVKVKEAQTLDLVCNNKMMCSYFVNFCNIFNSNSAEMESIFIYVARSLSLCVSDFLFFNNPPDFDKIPQHRFSFEFHSHTQCRHVTFNGLSCPVCFSAHLF